MDDPALPPNLARWMADVERRLRNAETAPRLRTASVTAGGSIVVPDASGNVLGIMGHIQDGDPVHPDIDFSSDGFLVRSNVADNRQALMWADVHKGWISPPQPVNFTKTGDNRVITSTSFVAAWSQLVAFQSLQIQFNFTALVDIGSTAQLRFTVGGNQVGSTLSLASGASKTWQYSGSHGAPLGLGKVTFAIEGRIASGSGNLYVYQPQGAYISYGFPETGFTEI